MKALVEHVNSLMEKIGSPIRAYTEDDTVIMRDMFISKKDNMFEIYDVTDADASISSTMSMQAAAEIVVIATIKKVISHD